MSRAPAGIVGRDRERPAPAVVHPAQGLCDTAAVPPRSARTASESPLEDVIAQLGTVASGAPSRDLVELVERVVGHVVKVIMHADDSSGLIGDLARDLLDVHAKACDAGVADPVKLAQWMVRFRFRDQDFFEVDPVRYAGALGERGLAAYRKAVAQADSPDSFAARHAQERLAILDGDIDALIETLGGDLSRAHQFQRVAEAMLELDRPDLALEWAMRGIAESSGWQVAELYDLASRLHVQANRPSEALRLRRAHHERTPSASSYAALRSVAGTCDAWDIERDAARAVLERADRRAYICVLLDDGDDGLAWEIATASEADEIDLALWLRLAEHRQATHPSDALAVYTRAADAILVETDRRAYRRAVQILKRAREAARAAGQAEAFATTIARLREAHRRRPTFIATLDKAKLTEP